MTSRSELDWLQDGSPYSPRFGDRYHSHQDGGVSQSKSCFLQGCNLPLAWQEQPLWRVLETGFGLGLNFLVTWQAWLDDAQRPQRLHFISTEAWPLQAEELLQAARQRYPMLLPLAGQLAAQYRDMHAGVHRLVFEQGRVHLTLAIGDARSWLRSQAWHADSVFLDGFNPTSNPDIWSLDTMKAVARCCRPGHTRLSTWCVAASVREALTQTGFEVERVAGVPPKKHNLRALYAPKWQPRPRADTLPFAPVTAELRSKAARHCVVVGAGIAGAAMARAMADRGWQVSVLEQSDAVASQASALPLGLFAPHVSPDDAPLSRLTREGVRCTRRLAAGLLREGLDWQPGGVLEHRVGKHAGLPKASAPVADQSGTSGYSQQPSQASRLASAQECVHNGITPAQGDNADPVLCHTMAGWIRPAMLVRALLLQPCIRVLTGQQVAAVTAAGDCGSGPWRLCDARGEVLLEADCVVIAAAAASAALLPPEVAQKLPLNVVRGQIAWGTADAARRAQARWPERPVNGKGSFVHAPLEDSAEELWMSGGTFERENPLLAPDEEQIRAALAENRQRLALLMPEYGPALQHSLFDADQPPNTWSGVRCTVPDRHPIYGPVLPGDSSLLLCAGLGSRGLTLAFLCAEILAAALHEEPLPVAADLARHIFAQRFI